MKLKGVMLSTCRIVRPIQTCNEGSGFRETLIISKLVVWPMPKWDKAKLSLSVRLVWRLSLLQKCNKILRCSVCINVEAWGLGYICWGHEYLLQSYGPTPWVSRKQLLGIFLLWQPPYGGEGATSLLTSERRCRLALTPGPTVCLKMGNIPFNGYKNREHDVSVPKVAFRALNCQTSAWNIRVSFMLHSTL